MQRKRKLKDNKSWVKISTRWTWVYLWYSNIISLAKVIISYPIIFHRSKLRRSTVIYVPLDGPTTTTTVYSCEHPEKALQLICQPLSHWQYEILQHAKQIVCYMWRQQRKRRERDYYKLTRKLLFIMMFHPVGNLNLRA